jgi:hypothetical protein
MMVGSRATAPRPHFPSVRRLPVMAHYAGSRLRSARQLSGVDRTSAGCAETDTNDPKPTSQHLTMLSWNHGRSTLPHTFDALG